MTPQAYIFIGRYGAGKGTQANLLSSALKQKDPNHICLRVEPGKEFRSLMNGESYTSKLTKDVQMKGGLMPEFMPIYIWSKLLVNEFTGNEHLIFDGAPRKLLEAQVLETAFPFYGFGKPCVIYLDVHHEESSKRLQLRSKSSGRPDDGAAEIENRRTAYERDVVPVINYYRNSSQVHFMDINGVRTIEEVHADIVKSLGLE
ncbi:MAG: nucleoside monophosphate kinase [Patescibacteria group bacterium]